MKAAFHPESSSLSPRKIVSSDKLLLRALAGQATDSVPIWLMRQAGRYLPEYRETRARAGTFLELCFSPDLAEEVSLQPIRRYGFDAAILFSDILVVPHGLGQEVWFEEGRGPRLHPLREERDLAALRLDQVGERLAPVLATITRLRGSLPPDTALIGFAGAPWTVASYMIEGESSRDFAAIKGWAYGEPDRFQRLIDLLVEATAGYLSDQVAAGAEVLQIFDSWAGVLPEEALRRWSLAPMSEIVARVKADHPEVPIILFPRGAGLLYRDFATSSGADCLSLDVTVPLGWARDELQPHIALQGNLDPIMLVTGGGTMEQAVATILERLGGGPFIFNLGHGIVPRTDPGHVKALVELVRRGQG